MSLVRRTAPLFASLLHTSLIQAGEQINESLHCNLQLRSFAKKRKDGEKEGGFQVEFAPVVVEDPSKLWQPCRFKDYYENILQRELLIKLCLKKLEDLPQLKCVTISMSSEEMRTPREYAERWEMLTCMLALEHLGLRPAEFVEPTLKYYKGKVVGVMNKMEGENMFNFLEKLVHLVLPAEIGFDGIPMPQRVRLDSRFKYLHATEFKVSNLLLYPDFEENFDIFEELRTMTVRVEVENAKSRWHAAMMLTGLALPIKGYSPGTQELQAAYGEK